MTDDEIHLEQRRTRAQQRRIINAWNRQALFLIADWHPQWLTRQELQLLMSRTPVTPAEADRRLRALADAGHIRINPSRDGQPANARLFWIPPNP